VTLDRPGRFSRKTKALIERYARRMTIEQRLAEIIRAFHTDALSSAVSLNVDLDVLLAVLVGQPHPALRVHLNLSSGYHQLPCRSDG
jgi:hypothetical protein